MTNRETFQLTLTEQYKSLFSTDPEYKDHNSFITPERLAEKMITAFVAGSANKDGKGVKRTCKVLNIPYTYKGIFAYLKG